LICSTLTELLLKRLKIAGLPGDFINLKRIWFAQRSFYVSIYGENSMLYDPLLETVQGSTLGPVLYAIFISHMFDIKEFHAFSDDSFIPRWNNSSLNKFNT
jgi:hypothetical protein